MHHHHTHRLATWTRLIVLSLLLGLGGLASLGLVGRTAHAQPTSTISVGTCDEATLRSAIANAAPGDTITFGCSGDILLGSTLVISTNNLTLDGNGQTVTLDGGNRVEVLIVNFVTFTLKSLTIAHGFPSGAESAGGGLKNEGGTVRISNSTFANNSAGGGWGGGLDNFGSMTISNSTFANNSAGAGPFGAGGGALLTEGGTVSISNSTFANNSATADGGIANEYGTVSISGSIVANNAGGNCSGGVSDGGYNLESGTDCGFTGTGDQQNTGPKLDPSGLQSNGGPTQTLALLAGSQAIDHIPAGQCPATDQRGMTRPDDSETSCDIGAYESSYDADLGLSALPTNMTVNATSPKGATVTYTPPTVVDEDSPLPAVSCTPASGSTFAIGTTTVTCKVSDSDDSNSPVSQSFTVTVNGAATQVKNLISLVNSYHLSSSLQNALDNKLKDVLTAMNAGQTATACSELTDFIGFVQSHTGKGLTTSQATQLIAAAKQVQAVLGC